MKIDHIAIWVDDLEQMREFYQRYFDVSCGAKYTNPNKGYSSYFLSFGDGCCRIELMHRPDIDSLSSRRGMTTGLAHISISVGSREDVDRLTHRLRSDGYTIIGEPRTSGDGYYESVVFDPEGNYVELLG